MYPTQALDYQDPLGTGDPLPGRTLGGQSHDDYWSQYQSPGPRDRKNHYDNEKAGWRQYDSKVHSGKKYYYPPVTHRAPARGETPAYLSLKNPYSELKCSGNVYTLAVHRDGSARTEVKGMV